MSFAIRILAALLITGVAATSCSQDGDQMAGLGPADPSALESAAGRGDVARVSALLSEGADPNYGVYTSPIFAVVDDREPSSTAAEVIRLLVDSGADIDGVLSQAIACVVTRDEHRRIDEASRRDRTLVGWDRYRAAGVEVIDLLAQRSMNKDADGGSP